MGAYSLDLRERIISATKRGDRSQKAVAQLFGVSLSFVEKLVKRERTTGSCAALPWAGGRQRALKNDTAVIEAAVKKQPDIALAELCEHVVQAGGAPASPSMMCRELQRLHLPRKKSLSRE
jgi:transposase